jgi:hypothetical protein
MWHILWLILVMLIVINQHKQIHVGTHIYHVCNILSNMTIMLDFLIIMDIATFDVNHDEHI